MTKLLLTLTLLLTLATAVSSKERKIDFWNKQHKGANYHNLVPTKQWWLDAKAAGINIVRLFPNNWQKAGRDFLIGDADNYERISEPDFQKLKDTLDHAQAVGIKVVITTVSLPGSRFRDHNDGKDDTRLWRDENYQNQSIAFWKELSLRLKNHAAVVGYNILNEPHPERARVVPFDDFWWDDIS